MPDGRAPLARHAVPPLPRGEVGSDTQIIAIGAKVHAPPKRVEDTVRVLEHKRIDRDIDATSPPLGNQNVARLEIGVVGKTVEKRVKIGSGSCRERVCQYV